MGLDLKNGEIDQRLVAKVQPRIFSKYDDCKDSKRASTDSGTAKNYPTRSFEL
jgi:hypothetical protein